MTDRINVNEAAMAAVEPGTEQQLNASADGNQTTTANAGAGH